MAKKALLMILDGWGIGDHGKDDVIFCTPTPYMDYLAQNYPMSQLLASGENVGLPDGQMGNSEVGHLNIGAGRIVLRGGQFEEAARWGRARVLSETTPYHRMTYNLLGDGQLQLFPPDGGEKL